MAIFSNSIHWGNKLQVNTVCSYIIIRLQCGKLLLALVCFYLWFWIQTVPPTWWFWFCLLFFIFRMGVNVICIGWKLYFEFWILIFSRARYTLCSLVGVSGELQLPSAPQSQGSTADPQLMLWFSLPVQCSVNDMRPSTPYYQTGSALDDIGQPKAVWVFWAYLR